MSELNIPDELLDLERAAVAAHADFLAADTEAREEKMRAWREAASNVQAAITEHARSAGANRYEVEQAVKRIVRHPEPETE